MAYLVDTNIFIHARDGNAAVRAKFIEHAGALLLSALSLAELQRGLHAPVPDAVPRRARHEILIDTLSVVAFDTAAAEAYGRVVAQVGPVKSRDTDHLIAAHALALRAVLVTDNEADFAGLPGLPLENWVTP